MSEPPRVVLPSPAHRAAFLRMAQEWRDHGSDRYALALADFDGYLARLARLADPARTPADRVPGCELWLAEGEEIVAVARLRFWLTPELEREGGHVGYDVRPSARRRGFGRAALEHGLAEARRRGIDPVRLTVDDDNLASIRIIESCGGVRAGATISATSGKPILQFWIAQAVRVVEKAFAYVTWQGRVLVFDHVAHPEAGTQVPAGTLEPGEAPVHAVVREAIEETGLASFGPPVALGVREVDARPYGKSELHRRHFFELPLREPPRERWRHFERHGSDGTGAIELELYWLAPDEAAARLSFDHGALLDALARG